MMRTPFAIAIFSLWAGLASAQAETYNEPCVFQPESAKSCARFVGCVNEDGTHLWGTARGWKRGLLYGQTSTGELCSGTWEYRPMIEKGEGTFTCDNGETTKFAFFSRSDRLGIISGAGISSAHNRIRIWSGGKLKSYLKIRFPNDGKVGFQCGNVWVPFPQEFIQ